MTLRAMIVDDEPLARERIRTLLQNDSEVEIVAECGNGTEALAVVKNARPDLLFLDIQMPGMDGFACLDAMREHSIPVVVFVTAFDDHALQAFEYAAVDYLLKPFPQERFVEALDRAKMQAKRVEPDPLREQIDEMLASLRTPTIDRLVVRESGRVHFVRVSEIRWVGAQGQYVEIHLERGSHLLRRPLKELEARLDARRFVRIHRSTLVNLDFVRQLQPLSHGEFLVVLEDGTELQSNRSFRERLEALLEERF